MILELLALAAMVDWVPVVKAVEKGVPRIEIAVGDVEGICSGVVINKDSGFVLTAAHCVEGENPALTVAITVNDRHAEIARVNRKLDLAVVRTSLRPGDTEVAIAEKSPPAGEEVAVIGYAFGVAKLTAQFGRVAQSYNDETKTIWLDASVIPGNSGGAIIDAAGRLVGLTSRIYYSGPSSMGAAIPVEQIEDFVTPYVKVKK
jgi:S1-C subfamily serine protease